MPLPIDWTPGMDELLVQRREAGECWHQIAHELQVGRNTCIERARVLGVVAREYLAAPLSGPEAPGESHDAAGEEQGRTRDDLSPLRAGSPVSWGAITAGTCLQGEPYEF